MNNYQDFANLTDKQQLKLLKTWHETEYLSVPEIAKKLNTYPNKIKRRAIALGYQLRNRSETQKVALSQGKITHPTQGKKRSANVKNKISLSKAEAWANLDDAALNQFKKKQKENWDNLPEEKKKEIRSLGAKARLQTAKDGSKLEKTIKDLLEADGYYVEFHKEFLLTNEKIHIDMFLPKEKIAIEIDGPSHFEPIWGMEVLEKTQKTDMQKDGLVVNAGYCMIRVRQKQNISQSYCRLVYKELLDTIKKIQDKFPPLGQRRIIL